MAPERQHGMGWLASRPIAHRGLHDEARGVPENSLAAFRAACEHGFAIECDVRLSADGVPMVFHDRELERLTGLSGELGARMAGELGAITLLGTSEPIPTLRAVLDHVAGRVPLVVELKGRSREDDAGFADALRPLLADYDGHLALMSFDPWLIEQALAFSPRRPVGLTAEGRSEDELANHRALFEQGCAFTSYNLDHLPNAFVDWVRESGRPAISWTVRTPQDALRSAGYADQITFEGFLPQA